MLSCSQLDQSVCLLHKTKHATSSSKHTARTARMDNAATNMQTRFKFSRTTQRYDRCSTIREHTEGMLPQPVMLLQPSMALSNPNIQHKHEYKEQRHAEAAQTFSSRRADHAAFDVDLGSTVTCQEPEGPLMQVLTFCARRDAKIQTKQVHFWVVDKSNAGQRHDDTLHRPGHTHIYIRIYYIYTRINKY